MPITYNAAEDIWELTNPTVEEKDALIKIAIGEITGFFGEEMASKIVRDAAEAHSAKMAQVPQQVEEASAQSFQAEGQVGQA